MLKAFEIIQAVGIEYMIENGKEEELKKVNADSLVIVGMMNHMCIDTTVGEAQNYDYKVTLSGMFAEVLSAEEYLKL